MFNLPKSTEVQKVIPKNAFDKYTNSKQKKSFSDKLLRITWMNKLSRDTINLSGNDIEEIHVFEIELKEKIIIKDLLLIIDKAISYTIIFCIKFEQEYYLSTSVKHPNPKDVNNAVVDYTFSTDWFRIEESSYFLQLKNDLDWIFKIFCEQFKSSAQNADNIKDLVAQERDIDALQKEIMTLKTAIKNCKQFNKKVVLNIKLKQLEYGAQ